MTSVRKRKMARSSVRKNTRRRKDKQRDINIHSNPIIAANWDKSLTLQQNYKKLGLRAKLGTLAGGQEKEIRKLSEIKAAKEEKARISPKEIEQTDDPRKIPEGEARLIRHPETNEVVRVIYGIMKASTENEEETVSEAVKQLEECAQRNASIKRERNLSERESDWIKSLYEKHGDDYEKMKWDKKLNVYQQSASELKKKVLKWKKANSIV